MKTLITGISGRIGANLARELIEQGHQVRGMVWKKDRRLDQLRALNVELIDVNLADHIPTFYESDLAKSRRLFDYRPSFDIFGMIDSAVVFRQGIDIGVIPTYVLPAPKPG